MRISDWSSDVCSSDLAPVASDISLEFLPPEIFIGPGSGCVAAAFMSVPEAAMDEHPCFARREHKVGGAGQPPHMQSISKTPGEKEGPKYQFRPGVLAANARHQDRKIAGWGKRGDD